MFRFRNIFARAAAAAAIVAASGFYLTADAALGIRPGDARTVRPGASAQQSEQTRYPQAGAPPQQYQGAAGQTSAPQSAGYQAPVSDHNAGARQSSNPGAASFVPANTSATGEAKKIEIKVPKKGEKVTINFVDVELQTLVNFFSKITEKNFIYDDRYTGKVTIIAPNKLTVKEAFDLFISILELKGFSIVKAGSAYKIIPSGGIRQGSVEVVTGDRKGPQNETFVARLIPLLHVQSQDLAPVLQPLISRDGYLSSFGKGNALLVVDNGLNISKILDLVKLLDIEPRVSSKINLYYLENADATEVAKVIESLTRGGSASPGMPPVTTELSGKVAVTPDKTTNSLIILSSPDDFINLSSVIKKLDRRPRQVFVEAMITEVSINKTLDLGTKWRDTERIKGQPFVIGGVGSVDSGTAMNILSGMAGLTLGGMAKFMDVPVLKPDGTVAQLTVPGFAALFNLSEFKDAIDVLSTPHILTSDNKEAEIVVGENVPFLSKFENQTAANQPILQSIERKDVGITLKIKPQISEGGYIKLDLYQEISSLSTASAQKASDVITSKRSAKTSVVVKDKQTVVIGGLIQDKEVKTETKVPLLGDIPLLGWLFKTSTTEKQKTNLLVYLTPSIVRDFDTLDEIKERKSEEFNRSHNVNNGEKSQLEEKSAKEKLADAEKKAEADKKAEAEKKAEADRRSGAAKKKEDAASKGEAVKAAPGKDALEPGADAHGAPGGAADKEKKQSEESGAK